MRAALNTWFINTGFIQWRCYVALRLHFGIVNTLQTLLNTQHRNIHIDEISLTQVGNPSQYQCHGSIF